MSNQNQHKPGYKRTPLGWIPEEWHIKEFAEISIKILDGTHFSPKSKNGHYKYITSKNIRNEGLDLSDIIYIDEKEHSEIFKRCPVEYDDILLTKDGAGTGTCCKNSLNEPFSLLSSVAVIRSNEDVCHNDYLFQYIKSPRGQFVIKDAIAGQAITRITLEKIRGFNIIVATIPEQRKIAAILSTWDEAITKTRQLIAQLQQRNKGLMQQLLTGEIRLNGFNGDWNEIHLSDAFKERNETGYVNLDLLSVGSLGIYPQSQSEKRDISNADKSKYKRICPGDIGYNTMRMWQGRSALSQLEGIVSPAYTIVTPQTSQSSLFYSFLFKLPTVVHKFFRNSQGLVEDTLNCKFKDFSIVKVKVPEYEEQVAIANLLVKANAEIQLYEQKLAALQRQKKGLMQKLLTGEVRVKID